MIEQRHFSPEDYPAVCDFLLALSRNNLNHINWNWARFEWEWAHPEMDKENVSAMSLWWDDGRVVGAALYDMYFGEGMCAVLPGYETLYPLVVTYALENLSDESGFALTVQDGDSTKVDILRSMRFVPMEQEETILERSLTEPLICVIPEGLHMESFDPALEPERFQWLLWQGFDHGEDKAAFLAEEKIVPTVRPHLNAALSVAAVDNGGGDAAYCCLWYAPSTDYAYVEPVCTVPHWRGKGAGRAVVTEALTRARALGARRAFVISDQEFYYKLGFRKACRFTFYHKEGTKK